MANASFAERIAAGESFVVPGCFDTISGLAIQRAGFDAAFVTGYGVSGSVLGRPDAGLIQFNDMLQRGQEISTRLDIPVIVDADTGYGNPMNVIRTISEFEYSGIDGLMIEDQVAPKQHPEPGEAQETIPISTMESKIRAAVETRQTDDFVVIARTDATGEQALERAERYDEAGADLVYVVSKNEAEIELFGAELDVPLATSALEWRLRAFSVEELQSLGYQFLIFPLALVHGFVASTMQILSHIAETGTTVDLYDDGTLASVEEYKEFIDQVSFERTEQRYLG